MSIEACPSTNDLAAFLSVEDEEGTASARALYPRVAAHCDDCPDCQEMFTAVRALLAAEDRGELPSLTNVMQETLATVPTRNSDMSCLNDALSHLLKRDVGLPDAVPMEENEAICARLGLVQFDNPGAMEIDHGTPAVFIIATRPSEKIGHALYVAGSRLGEFFAWNTHPVLSIIVKAEDAGRIRYTASETAHLGDNA